MPNLNTQFSDTPPRRQWISSTSSSSSFRHLFPFRRPQPLAISPARNEEDRANTRPSLEGRLLVAIPKKGRLNHATLNLLEGADIQFKRENRLDIALVKNLPIALIFLPAADIPTFVGEGQVDLGITGWDQVQEHDARVRAYNRSRRASVGGPDADQPAKTSRSEVVMKLDFGHCKLQVQAPTNGPYQTSADLVGKTIGTSFVDLAAEHFGRLEMGLEEGASGGDVPMPKKLRTKIIELSGSVEAACALGVADGIVDLVGEYFPASFPLTKSQFAH